MRLQNFNHLVEQNLSHAVSFVVVQEWVEVQFAGYILDFLSRKSGPNMYHQSQVYYKIVGRKKKMIQGIKPKNESEVAEIMKSFRSPMVDYN